MSESKKAEAPDFSKMSAAQVRLWKRKQRLQAKANERMAIVSGAVPSKAPTDLVETKGSEVIKTQDKENAEAKKEKVDMAMKKDSKVLKVEGEISEGSIGSPSLEETKSQPQQVQEKAAWEKKWEKSVRRAQQDKKMEIPDVPSFGAEKSSLRQRKPKSEESSPETSKPDTPVTNVKAEEYDKGLGRRFSNLQNIQKLVLAKSIIIVLIAIFLARFHLMLSPFEDLSVVALSGGLSRGKPVDDELSDEVTVDLSEMEQSHEEILVEKLIMIEPPLYGWATIPLALLLLHVGLCCIMFLVNGSSSLQNLVQPSLGLSGMLEKSLQASALGKFILIPRILQSVLDDTALFVFVFTLSVAVGTLML